MLRIFDHDFEGVERLLAGERSYLGPRDICFGAGDGGAYRRQESRLVYTGHFDLHRTRGLATSFLPIHVDLSMRVAFENRRAAHCMDRDSPAPGNEIHDLLS